MDTYQVVLYIHFLSLLIAIGAASVVFGCLFGLRGAQTLADAVPWGMLAGKMGLIFPISALGLFGSGAYMASDLWSWSTGWIVVGIVALVVVTAQGKLIAEHAAKRLQQGLRENGPGPLGENARRLVRQPALWFPAFSNVGLVAGVMWGMTQKPGTFEAIAAAVVGYAIGMALALTLAKAGADRPAAVPSAEPGA